MRDCADATAVEDAAAAPPADRSDANCADPSLRTPTVLIMPEGAIVTTEPADKFASPASCKVLQWSPTLVTEAEECLEMGEGSQRWSFPSSFPLPSAIRKDSGRNRRDEDDHGAQVQHTRSATDLNDLSHGPLVKAGESHRMALMRKARQWEREARARKESSAGETGPQQLVNAVASFAPARRFPDP